MESQDKRLAALHEAAHAVTGFVYRLPVNSIEIHPVTVTQPIPVLGYEPGIWAGRAQVDLGQRWKDRPFEQSQRGLTLVDEICRVIFAGQAIEHLITGEARYWRYERDFMFFSSEVLPLLGPERAPVSHAERAKLGAAEVVAHHRPAIELVAASLYTELILEGERVRAVLAEALAE